MKALQSLPLCAVTRINELSNMAIERSSLLQCQGPWFTSPVRD
jgi:hypothetical protein